MFEHIFLHMSNEFFEEVKQHNVYTISIHDPQIDTFVDLNNIKNPNCLFLEMFDLENPLSEFSEVEADKIKMLLDLTKLNPDAQLIIHCEAGLSRSGAIGCFACKYLGFDEEVFKSVNPNILPNSYILEFLYDRYGYLFGKTKEDVRKLPYYDIMIHKSDYFDEPLF